MRLMLLSAAILLGLLPLAAPASAAPFDGRWIAEMPPEAGPGCGTAVMNVTVVGDTVIGQIPNRHAMFRGTLEDDGTGPISFGHDTGTIRFSGDHFEVNYITPKCGQHHVMGDRAPTDADNARMADERQKKQSRFAEMTGAAEAGETVDYSALRVLYPYTEYWDPYGNRTDALVQEANGAVKGKDCAQAMALLGQVLKYDFTIDGAHALRSDCLKTGDPHRAAIEDGVANGLVRSLMQSGDGNSEATAYVVSTAREERDVLANRSIQLKTQETQVRGANGHYYELLDGVSLKDGVTLQKVYFDVSAFVAGRLSRAAAVAVVAESLH
jgi:hypothetical protein